jgi:hypothetical protein
LEGWAQGHGLCSEAAGYRRVLYELDGDESFSELKTKLENNEELSPEELNYYYETYDRVMQDGIVKIKKALKALSLCDGKLYLCGDMTQAMDYFAGEEGLPPDSAAARGASSKSAAARTSSSGRYNIDVVSTWIFDGKSVEINGVRLDKKVEELVREKGYIWFADSPNELIETTLKAELTEEESALIFENSEITDMATARTYLNGLDVGEVGRIKLSCKIETSPGLSGESRGHIIFVQRISDDTFFVFDPAGRPGTILIKSDSQAFESALKQNLINTYQSYLAKYTRALNLPADGPPPTIASRSQILQKLEKQIYTIFGVIELKDAQTIEFDSYSVFLQKS